VRSADESAQHESGERGALVMTAEQSASAKHWDLANAGRPEELQAILDDIERPYYEHEVLAT
jgi:hypothetical protein